MRRRVAVVLAGGAGERAGGTARKQLAMLAGSRVVDRAIAALHDVDEVDQVVLVAPVGRAATFEATMNRARFPKLSRVVEGGADRHASTRAGLAAIDDDDCDVLVHDAARPLVDATVVRACISALDDASAVVPAIATPDAVIEVDDSGAVVVGAPARERLRLVQTPQCFRISVLREAYERADAEGDLSSADNCGVVRRHLPDVAVHVVAGSRRNVKVTHPEDLVVAEALLSEPS